MLERKSFSFAIILFLLVVFVLTFTVYGQEDEDTFTLGESIDHALENNFDILLKNIDLEQAENYYQKSKTVGDEELIENARNQLQFHHEQLEMEKSSVVTAVEQQYYALIQATENLQAQQKALARQKKQLEADEIKFVVGLISIIDIENSRDSYQSMEKSFSSQEQSLKTRQMEFNILLGRQPEKSVHLVKESYFNPVVISLEDSMQIARENRNDIINARENLQEAELDLERIDNQFTPLIEIEQARADLRKAEIELEQTEQSLLITIRNSYFSFKGSFSAIDTAQRQQERAARELEAATLKYEAGKISTGEMLAAQEKLVDTEKDVIKAKWDYNLAISNFLKTLGVWNLQDYLDGVDSGLLYEELIENHSNY